MLPWGLGRQADPGSAAFVPRLRGEGITNRTGRRWTVVGPAGGPGALVDPAGLVTPRPGGWSVDWWVGADDRWRLPSREAAVRQALLGSAPVVETAMRIPSGDAVHRVYGVPGFLVLEVENRSPTPFALALSVRPYDPLGATAAGSVAVDGRAVQVDGRTALVLPGPPGRAAASTGSRGDVAAAVLDGRAGLDAEPTTCPVGLASVAVLVPVAHRTTVRALIPSGEREDVPGGAPSADAVVRGWAAQGRIGLRAEVPDPLLQRSFDAARLSLLVLDHDDPGPAEEAAVLTAALARLGRHAEADDLVRALWSRQRTDGSFDEPSGRGAPGGAHLWALGEHLRLRPEPPPPGAGGLRLASGAGGLRLASGAGGLRLASGAGGLAAALDRGLVAAEGWLREGEASGRLPPTGRRWALAGRRAAGAAAGEAGLAVAASALLTGAAASPAREPLDAAPTAAAVLALVLPDPPRQSSRERRAVEGPAGFDVVATVAAAAAELGAGESRALDRLAWLIGVGGPTWSWPDHVHPRTGAGSDGRGASPLACAGFLLLVRDLLVIEPAPGHAVLLPVLPDSWRGQPADVHDVVLSGGVRLSFAVRWHGPRPALLWEASRPVRLSAPALDRSFSSVEQRGEVLLGGAPSPTAADGGTVELS